MLRKTIVGKSGMMLASTMQKDGVVLVQECKHTNSHFDELKLMALRKWAAQVALNAKGDVEWKHFA